MPQYALRTEYQWNGELQLSAGEKSICHNQKFQAFAAVRAEAILQNGLTSVKPLQEEPFSSLPNCLVNAIRDEHFRKGFYDHLDSATFDIVRTSCLQRLNQNAGDGSILLMEREKMLNRQVVLLSLISPHAVISSLCEWAERQTLPEKRKLFCNALAAIENAVAYRTALDEPGTLVSWFNKACIESCKSENSGRMSRLCATVSQLLMSYESTLIAPLSIEICLQFLVRPLSKLGYITEGYEVIRAIFSNNHKNRTIRITENESITDVLDLVCTAASIENRRNGKMATVEHAFLSISTILSNLSQTFAEKYAARIHPHTTLPLQCRVHQFCPDREELLAAHLKQLSLSFEDAFNSVNGLCLKSCERVIVLLVGLISFEASAKVSKGDLLGNSAEKLSHAEQEATQSELVWILALARQLPMLTSKELEVFLDSMHPKVLVRAFPGTGYKIGRESITCKQYFGELMASNLGFRAISLLLRDSELLATITSDDLAILRVTRMLCSFVSSTIKGRSGAILPRAAFRSILSDCFEMAETACGDDQSYHRTHNGFVDILTATVLEVSREMSKTALLVHDYDALGQVSKLIEEKKHGNSITSHLARNAAIVFKEVDESPYAMDV